MADSTANHQHAAGLSRSIANPRRTTLVSVSASEAAAPQRAEGGFTMVGPDDAGVCVDGTCALPE
ncbi:hypothetical protein [Cellulosimicrobium sp. NPDC057127]|uniref:hypothetical protein n=1 Tax=Cellulosimicrobium sp. NPDC057127 TaxID=3346026 RepID=UPI00362F23F9